jgi:UDP-GlcNAc3NAcA epimerase
MKIATIVGARPQFVKAAMLSRALRAIGFDEMLIHTGQHYDDNMSRVFFDELEIPEPDINLGIGSGPHGAQTGRMLEAVESVLVANRPLMIIVYGDTNSTLAGALAAVKLQIPVAHVEAGLRSFNRGMPEELNRVLVDHVSEFLFAPTRTAVTNLLHEGIVEEAIHLVGDVMFDATLYFGAKAEKQSRILQRLSLDTKNYVLVTVHRAENTDNEERLRELFLGLTEIAEDIPTVIPLHPRTRVSLSRLGFCDKKRTNIRLIEPVGYFDMLMLQKHAQLIVTDSGGVQKEAFFHKVLCVTVRDETEWVELVELGWNHLLPPTSRARVVEGVRQALRHKAAPCISPYGEGNSAELIAKVLQGSVDKNKNEASRQD